MIITRDIIRDDAIFITDKAYTKKDLCEFINYWKDKLLSMGAQPGDKIGISLDNIEIHYYALLFASFELGMQVVSLHRPNSQKECETPKSNAHLPLDFYFYLDYYLTVKDSVLGIKHFKDNSKKCISYGPLEWKLHRDSFRSTQETPVYAQPKDIAFCCTSSGTTGKPKLITYSHMFLYELSRHNRSVLNYREDDVMMHFSTLNHGGVIALLLPALMMCHKHHFNTFTHGIDTVNEIVDYCIENGVTKVFCSNGSIVKCFVGTLRIRDLKMPNATIFLLSFICPTWVDAIKEGRLKSIVSPFGCSEIGGPVFLPYLSIDNVDTFNPKYLGKPLTGFYDTRIVCSHIHTTLPNGSHFIFDDLVTGDFHFISKNRLPKINDIDINPLDIIEIVEKYESRYVFEVYVDEIYNEIYLISGSQNLYNNRSTVVDKVKEYYLGNVPVTMIYEARLHDTRISHKADTDKIKKIVERYRLTIQKDAV